MKNGKTICNQLKDIRRGIAAKNGIELEIPECTYEGDCQGTCPRCDAELQYLERELTNRNKIGKAAAVAGLTVGLAAGINDAMAQVQPDEFILEGDVVTNISDSCTLRGTLHSRENGHGIVGVHIWLEQDGIKKADTITNPDGYYQITVPKGLYKIRFIHPDFQEESTILELQQDELDLGNIRLSSSVVFPPLMGIVPYDPSQIEREEVESESVKQ